MPDVQDRWTQLQALFEGALERAPDERTAWLRNSCGDDPELYAEIEALIRGEEEAHSMFSGHASAFLGAAAFDEALAANRKGERIGPWRLHERIGEGGMGAVFRAERAEGEFEQIAALKLIKPGMDSAAVIARFESERQILARLQHPGIARLLDGGLTEAGRPFFAMELVDGEPITDYCDKRRLSVNARLALFIRVCEPVRYAHQALVVHRDLKPSNILVVEEDGEVPRPVLLDFGIARMLEDEDDALLTRTGQRVLTPGTAAPEQVRGEAPTTATDVYALGGLLYRLLCGSPAIATEGRSTREIEEAVLSEIPKRASDNIAALADRDRSSSKASLQRELRGDLETICAKALSKESERRYGSAAELLSDIQRYLDGMPIEARPATRRYRFNRFFRRHRTGMLAAVAGLVFASSIVGFYTVRLAHERDRARLEAEKAEEVSEFLQGLFEFADPANNAGKPITAEEILAQGTKRVEEELADQPEVQTKMLQVISRVYGRLGLFDQGAEVGWKALRLAERVLGPRHPETAVTQAVLARSLLDRDDKEVADSLLTIAVSTSRADADLDPVKLAHVLQEYAWLQLQLGKTPRAVEISQEVADIRARVFGDDDEEVAIALTNLGDAYLANAQPEEAALRFERALAIQERELGPEHPEVATTLNNMGLALVSTGRFEEAIAAYDRVMAIDKKTLEPDHPYIATSLNNIGQALQGMGRYREAEVKFRESLAIRREKLGPRHSMTGESINNVAYVLGFQGRWREAVPVFQEAVSIASESDGDAHPNTVTARINLARALRAAGQLQEARAVLRLAQMNMRAAFPDGTEQKYLTFAIEQARLLGAENRAPRGLAVVRRALARQTDLAQDHAERIAARGTIAVLLAQSGDCAAARAERRAVQAIVTDRTPAFTRAIAEQEFRGC